MLPNDEKFINLEEDQKIFLFNGINSLPTSEVLRESTIYRMAKAEIEDKKPEDFVNDNMKKSMYKALGSQKLTDDQIKDQIVKFGQSAKANKLQELEKQYARR